MESRVPVARIAIVLRIGSAAMLQILSHEMLISAVEMVCYFCTAIGMAFTFMFVTRA
jgi:hypothetical protein